MRLASINCVGNSLRLIVLEILSGSVCLLKTSFFKKINSRKNKF
jgi:hypothetical protein